MLFFYLLLILGLVYGIYCFWSNQLIRPARGLVVVTGVSSGIGQTTALHLSALGFDVIGTVRSKTDVDKILKADSSKRLQIIICDVNKSADIEKLVSTVGDRPLVAVVQNAAITSGRVPLELDHPDHAKLMFSTNQEAVLNISLGLAGALKKDGNARIVTISSIAGGIVIPGTTLYSASKAAAEMLTIGIGRELNPWGVRGVIIRPGDFKTNSGINNWHWTEKAAERHAETRGISEYPQWWQNQVDGKAWLKGYEIARDPKQVAETIDYAIRARNPGYILTLYTWREFLYVLHFKTTPTFLLDNHAHSFSKFGTPHSLSKLNPKKK